MNNFDFSESFKVRTKAFAIRIIKLFRTLPNKVDAQVMGKQLLRSGTSVTANYRASCRARSQAEFISKMNIVVEEADECVLWLELLIDTEIVPKEKIDSLLTEAIEILAISATALKTAKLKR